MIFAAVLWVVAIYSSWFTWRAAKTGVLKGRGLRATREGEPAMFRGLIAFYAFATALVWIGAFAASLFMDGI